MADAKRVAFIVTSYGYAEPFGVMHLATIAKREGWDVRLFQTATDRKEDIIAFKPDVLAYSVLSSQQDEILSFNREIRKSLNAVSIMGGHHPTYFPEVVKDEHLDLICVGEGETAFAEFLQNYDKPDVWDSLNNLTTYPRTPKLNRLVTDFESVGFPDREIVYANPWIARQKMKSFYATRGCPFNCTYCMNHSFNNMYKHNGPFVRRRKVDHIIEEIQYVRKHWPLEFIRFNDDCFALVANEWLEEFCDKYKRLVGLPFWVQVRPDVVKEDALRLLKSAGCHVVGTSIESANPEIRKKILRRGDDNNALRKGFAMMRELGLKTQTNCIFALPGATLEDDKASIDFMIENKIDLFSTTIFQPFRGTDIFRYCLENNLVGENLAEYFPTSNWNMSVLKGYTEAEKRFQFNLTRFTPLIGLFPSLKGLCYWLSKFPPSPLFDLIFYIARHLAWKKVIPLRLSFMDVFGFVLTSLRLHFIKQKESGSGTVAFNKLKKFVLSMNMKFRFLFRLLATRKISIRKVANLALNTVRYYLKKEKAALCPSVVILDVTNRCNLFCKVCRHSQTEILDLLDSNKATGIPLGLMPNELFQKIIREVAKDVLFVLVYLSGEPLLNKNAARMIQFASDSKVATIIATNGMLLDEMNARQIIESGVDYIKVAVSGMTQDVYEREHRGGDIEVVKRNLVTASRVREELRSSAIIVMDYIVYDYNEHQVQLAQSFCAEHGIAISLRKGLIRNEAAEFSSSSYGKIKGKAMLCDWLWKIMSISWTGDALPCCEYAFTSSKVKLGNAHDMTIGEIWNGDKYVQYRSAHLKDGRKSFAMCKDCHYNGIDFQG